MIKRHALSSALNFIGCIVLTAATAVGGSIPIGSLLGSKNATLDGQAPLPHTTILSGDRLKVAEGLAMVALDEGNRMMLGRGTEASFSRETDGMTVSLTHGTVSLYHAEAGTGFRVIVGDVTVAPVRGYRTTGEITMVDGLVVVAARNGALQVLDNGTTRKLTRGETITITTAAASAPLPVPTGKLRIKRKVIITMAAIVGGTAATLATIALIRASAPASPIEPAP